MVLFGFFIVLAVDRHLVATLHKSRHTTSTKFYASLFCRFILAIFTGVMVSHPLVLFMFRETITENIVKVDKSNKQLEANSLEGKIKSATAEDASLLNERIAKRDCAIQLLQAEKYPTQTQSYEVWNATRTMICGTASGKAGCDMSENGGCASIKKDIIK